MTQMKSKPAPVTSGELKSLLGQKDELEQAMKWCRVLSGNIEKAEADVIARIQSGAKVDPAFEYTIKKSERRSVSWKEHFLRHVRDGKRVADRILARTRPTVTLELVLARKGDIHAKADALEAA